MKHKDISLNSVTVVGGGITGLTIAHELVDRGFSVTVVEKLAKPFAPGLVEVGGMARTQWSSIEGLVAFPNTFPRVESLMGGSDTLGKVLDGGPLVFFGKGSFRLNEKARETLEHLLNRLADYARARTNAFDEKDGWSPNSFHFASIEGEASADEATLEEVSPSKVRMLLGQDGMDEYHVTQYEQARRGSDTPARLLSRLRATVVTAYLRARMDQVELELTPVGLGGLADVFRDHIELGAVSIRLYEQFVPGEHGYRYFPSFYRHLFDTMRRTPVLVARSTPPIDLLRALELRRAWGSVPDELDVESDRTVFDNLVPTYAFKILPGDGKAPLIVPRTRARSIGELRKILERSLGDLGFALGDIARFQLKIFQYATACKDRRVGYEERSWWDFIGGERYGAAFQAAIEQWPQALIGIRARTADARTIGTITLQLLLDQFSSSGMRDATLNGPTSKAWLDPWQKYLEMRGVNFISGELVKLELDGEQVVPRWAERPAGAAGPQRPSSDTAYLVLAVPLLKARHLAETLWESATPTQREVFPASLAALRNFLGESPPPPDALPVEGRSAPSGPLRHYSGIQFYLRSDLGPADGHMYLASSEWRLSAISQAQFWRRRFNDPNSEPDLAGFARYISVLSVDIGDWHTQSTFLKKCAAECSRGELATEVWRQVADGLAQRRWQPPEPVAYHIDDDLVYARTGSREQGDMKPSENHAPYLVNIAGDWKKRPGPADLDKGYEVFFNGLVVAGTFMRTFTRLTTMEAANESGRHAVNAILAHYAERSRQRVSGNCMIVDPEDHEIDDLDFLKELDARLVAQGLPHLLEILDVEGLVDRGLPSPDGVLDALLGSLGPLGPTFAERAGIPLELLRRALQQLFG